MISLMIYMAVDLTSSSLGICNMWFATCGGRVYWFVGLIFNACVVSDYYFLFLCLLTLVVKMPLLCVHNDCCPFTN